MAQVDRVALKTYFETGDFPTQAQFIDFIDSCVNITDDPTSLGDMFISIYDSLILANTAKVSYDDSGNVVLLTGETDQGIEGNINITGQANSGDNIKAFTATATFDADDGNNQYMAVTSSTNVGISNELPGTMIIELEIISGTPTITPNANLGTVMDNSAAFINADNDINIITIYINPNGSKRYSVNTITA